MFLLKCFRRNQICIQIRLLRIKINLDSIVHEKCLRSNWNFSNSARMPKSESKPQIFTWTQIFLIEFSKTTLPQQCLKLCSNYPRYQSLQSESEKYCSFKLPWHSNTFLSRGLKLCSNSVIHIQTSLIKTFKTKWSEVLFTLQILEMS